MADHIQEQTGGDLLKLEPVNPYPTDYQEGGDVAKAERDENARPEISNLPESIAEYDTIFVGYPIWWHTAPMIIGIFLDSFDLNGVEISEKMRYHGAQMKKESEKSMDHRLFMNIKTEFWRVIK